MKPPTVLEGKEVEISDSPPPPACRWAPHKWYRDESLNDLRKAGPNGIELYVSKVAEEKMRNHSLAHASERSEVMGLMLGRSFRSENGIYAMVRDVVTTELEASSIRVRFKREALERLFESLESCGFDYVIVGWYHSHPGHGCFLSSTDIDTQMTLFNDRGHTAVVIDPIGQEIKAFFLDAGEVRERLFVVYWDEYQTPYYSRAVKRRMPGSDPDCMPSPEGGLGLPQPLHEDGNERVEE